MIRTIKRGRDKPTKGPTKASPNPKSKKQNKIDFGEERNSSDEETMKESTQEDSLQPRSLEKQFHKASIEDPKENPAEGNEGKVGSEQNEVEETPTNKTITELKDDDPPAKRDDPTETEYVYDWNFTGRLPPTQWFKDTPQTFVDRATGFSKEQVYPQENNKDTVHDHVRSARAMMTESEDPKFEPTVDDFMLLFYRALSKKHPLSKTKEGKQLNTLGLRLAKSSPEIYQDCYETKPGKLQDRRDTRAWLAANQTFGSHWAFTVKPTPRTIRPPPSSLKKKSSLQQTAIRFATTKPSAPKTNEKDTWKVVQTKRGLFRKKTTLEALASKKKQKNEHSRKHQTYLKARLPQSKSTTTADAEAVAAFKNIVDSLLKFDQRTVVYPWTKPWEKSNNSMQALTKSGTQPDSKATVEAYVDRLFLSAGKSPYIRFKIGHDQDIKTLENWDHPTLTELRSKDIQVHVEKIQDADIAIAGWFMGSNPKSFNCKSFCPVLQAHPLLSNKEIDLQTRSVKPDTKHKWSSSDPRAVHVFCARRNLDAVKKAMNAIYGSKSKREKMPMGRSLRFIPFTADPKGRAPLLDMKKNIQAAIRKQQRFIDATEVMELHGIVDLDYIQSVPGQDELSLREILQSMKASDFQTNMFLSVDEKWNGEVNLTFHKSLEDQAQMIVSYLPLLLAERFGPRAWGWFTTDTQVELSGYYWDPEKQCIASIDKDAVAANLEGFDEFDDLSDSPDDSPEENQIEINIEMQIDLDDPPDDARIVGDENRSVVTFGGILGRPDSPSVDTTENTLTTAGDTRQPMETDRPEDISTITTDEPSPGFKEVHDQNTANLQTESRYHRQDTPLANKWVEWQR